MSDKKDNVELGVKIAELIIRERLMEYFKGDCVQRVFSSYDGSIYLDQLPARRLQYYSERREQENRARQRLYIGEIPVIEMALNPREAKVFVNAFSTSSRTPNFLRLLDSIRHTFSEYLAGVDVAYDEEEKVKNRTYVYGDSRDDAFFKKVVSDTVEQDRPRTDIPFRAKYVNVNADFIRRMRESGAFGQGVETVISAADISTRVRPTFWYDEYPTTPDTEPSQTTQDPTW